MILEALEFLRNQFSKADGAPNKLTLVKIPESPPGNYLAVDKDGGFTHLTPLPEHRKHELDAVADMQTAINWAYDIRDEADRLTLWYDREGAVLVMNDEDHRHNAVTLGLRPTPIWSFLCTLEDRQPNFSHPELIRTIRLQLAPYLQSGALESILAPLRVLDFNGNTTGTSSVEENKTGFGKTVQNIVGSKAGKIPDEIVVSVKIYRDPALSHSYAIRLILDIDPAAGTFKLIPYPEDLEAAWERSTTILGSLLRTYSQREEPVGNGGEISTIKTMCPVFYGRP